MYHVLCIVYQSHRWFITYTLFLTKSIKSFWNCHMTKHEIPKLIIQNHFEPIIIPFTTYDKEAFWSTQSCMHNRYLRGFFIVHFLFGKLNTCICCLCCHTRMDINPSIFVNVWWIEVNFHHFHLSWLTSWFGVELLRFYRYFDSMKLFIASIFWFRMNEKMESSSSLFNSISVNLQILKLVNKVKINKFQ